MQLGAFGGEMVLRLSPSFCWFGLNQIRPRNFHQIVIWGDQVFPHSIFVSSRTSKEITRLNSQLFLFSSHKTQNMFIMLIIKISISYFCWLSSPTCRFSFFFSLISSTIGSFSSSYCTSRLKSNRVECLLRVLIAARPIVRREEIALVIAINDSVIIIDSTQRELALEFTWKNSIFVEISVTKG